MFSDQYIIKLEANNKKKSEKFHILGNGHTLK